MLCRVVPSTGQDTNVLTNTIPTPADSNLGIVADNGGNLWTAGFFGTGLFSYAIATRVVSGPSIRTS